MRFDILINFDDNYVQHSCVSINSIFQNNKEHDIHVHVIHDGLAQDNIDLMTNWVHTCEQNIYFYKIEDERIYDCPETLHFKRATYYRIWAANILPNDIKKVLYVDGDTVTIKALDELFAIDINNYALAAALGGVLSPDRKLDLGLDADYIYFQAGVLLINLDYWRKNNTLDKVFNNIQIYKEALERVDQDALNSALKNERVVIERKYNFGRPHYPGDIDKFDIVIIHYTGLEINKPWYSNSKSPFRNYYRQYMIGTPFENTVLPEFHNPKSQILLITGSPTSGKGTLVSLLDSHPDIFANPTWHDKLVGTHLKLNDGRRISSGFLGDYGRIARYLSQTRNGVDWFILKVFSLQKALTFCVSSSKNILIPFDFDYGLFENKLHNRLYDIPVQNFNGKNILDVIINCIQDSFNSEKRSKYFVSQEVNGFRDYKIFFESYHGSKVIYVNRDPVDWIYSWIKRILVGQPKTFRQYIRTLAKNEKKFIYNALTGLEIAKNMELEFPNKVKIINFNDLIMNTKIVMDDIADFLEIDRSENLYNPSVFGVNIDVIGKVEDNTSEIMSEEEKILVEHFIEAYRRNIRITRILIYSFSIIKKMYKYIIMAYKKVIKYIRWIKN